MYRYSDSFKIKMKEHRKYVVKAIELGVNMLDDDLTQENLSPWVNYVEEIIKSCVHGSPRSNAYIVFLELKLQIECNKKITPSRTLKLYLDYLFNVHETIELILS